MRRDAMQCDKQNGRAKCHEAALAMAMAITMANGRKGCDLPSAFRVLLFTSCGELILFFELGRGELFEVRVATAAMVVT